MQRNAAIAAICSFAIVALTAWAGTDTGKTAPAFTATDSQGNQHKLGDFAGKIVVLEWTNPDCPFVKKHYDTNNMQALQKKYTAKGVVWLSICSSAPGKQGHYNGAAWQKKVAEQKSHATAVLLDPDGTVGKLYGAKTTPHMYIVGTDGVLAYQGAIDSKRSWKKSDVKDAENHVAAALDALLAGKKPAVTETKPYGCSVKY